MSSLSRILRARDLVDAALSELTRAPAAVYVNGRLVSQLRSAHAELARLVVEGEPDDGPPSEGTPDTMPSLEYDSRTGLGYPPGFVSR